MTTIFPSAVIPVIIMGIVLELGKLSSVAFLHRYWTNISFLIKTYLIIAVITLMLINIMGGFGYLSKAHIEQEIINQSQTSQVEIVNSKLDNEKSVVKDLDNQIAQIDNALTKLTEQGKAQTSLSQGVQQRKQRDALVAQKNDHLKVLQDLTTQKITEDANNKKIQAEFGPLAYIADAFYGKATDAQLEITVRWIITIIMCVFDPLALVLLIASQHAFSMRKIPLTEPKENDTLKISDDIFGR